MQTSAKHFSTIEYGGFIDSSHPVFGYTPLPKHTFQALEDLILQNLNGAGKAEAIELFALSAKRSIGKVITARNYVGVVVMKDGTTIEILPKIHGAEENAEKTREIFMEMLRSLRIAPFKAFDHTRLKTGRLNIFEVFITMFVSETAMLCKQGLKANYVATQNNKHFFKGKLMVSEHLRYNLFNRERFYLEYDEFCLNRPENRLLKSTLRLLLSISQEGTNRQGIRRLLSLFDQVPFSTNYAADFDRCLSNREVKHYERALSWCKVFLRGNSFTSFPGSQVAIALLFPMETIFESYIATKLKRILRNSARCITQDRSHHLFSMPAKVFALQPDIVVEFDDKVFVMDTKWKILSGVGPTLGISQADMYQMYTYSKKYDSIKTFLIYPKTANKNMDKEICFLSKDDIFVEIISVDLLDTDNCLRSLLTKKCGILL
ncbi:MAG: McrC family protein [Saccharofermentanales bacterium]|jgi:5-methylcytosine-specific restriction enzyme subunit McrC